MAKKKVYLETSVISYLTARPNTDVIKLAKQELTRRWWNVCKEDFSLYVSRPVIEEISAGDPEAARLRREAVAGLPELLVTDESVALFDRIVGKKILPDKARLDILHMSIAAVNGINYLATWNCKHICNATIQKKIREEISKAGYTEVEMRTPEELWRL